MRARSKQQVEASLTLSCINEAFCIEAMDIKTLSIRPVEWIKCGMTVSDGFDFLGDFGKCVAKFAGDMRHV